jgi:hypothetical protein
VWDLSRRDSYACIGATEGGCIRPCATYLRYPVIRKRITVVPGLVTDVTFDSTIIASSSTKFQGDLREKKRKQCILLLGTCRRSRRSRKSRKCHKEGCIRPCSTRLQRSASGLRSFRVSSQDSHSTLRDLPTVSGDPQADYGRSGSLRRIHNEGRIRPAYGIDYFRRSASELCIYSRIHNF